MYELPGNSIKIHYKFNNNFIFGMNIFPFQLFRDGLGFFLKIISYQLLISEGVVNRFKVVYHEMYKNSVAGKWNIRKKQLYIETVFIRHNLINKINDNKNNDWEFSKIR